MIIESFYLTVIMSRCEYRFESHREYHRRDHFSSLRERLWWALKIRSEINGRENGKERRWDNTNIVYEY